MRRAWILAAVLIGCPMVGAEEPKPLQGKELVEALQKGGYVIFFRHTQTDPNMADTDTLNLENTKAQRHLTDKGREQAKAIGAAFKKLNIPVSQVFTSQFYRAVEVARLAQFGAAEAMVDVTEAQNVPPVESQRRAK